MGKFNYIGKRIIRKDGQDKATGKIKYMADIQMKDMLYGVLIHPPFPHAFITSVDISKAQEYPGVERVITAKDIPGENIHGLVYKDQPVLCDKWVKYLGDTVAVVVAATEETALQAAKLVDIRYTKLPEVLTAREALKEGAVVIHKGGNAAAQYYYKNGDIQESFRTAAAVVEYEFHTQYHEHAYLETEGGIARPIGNGGVEIWQGCQNGKRAARDLMSVLNLPEDKIIVHSFPLGGGFGGKDDLVLQGIMAVCALTCKKPVHVNFTREESFLVSPKRMPMEIHIKMAADENGKFVGNQVYALGTCGAYACYGPAIMSLAMEHACGMYYFPNIEISGETAYTNNCCVSAFRGFGNVQMNFAVETAVDMLAQKLHMDPIKIRKKNVLKPGKKNSYGYYMSNSIYAGKVVEELEKTTLWCNRQEFKQSSSRPWLKRGVGIAGCMQGVGLGNHCIPDNATGWVELQEDGSVLVSFGNEDMGQGNMTTLLLMAAEVLHISPDKLYAVCGISNKTPDTGSTSASKTTYVTGWAVVRAAGKLLEQTAKIFGCLKEELIINENSINGLTWAEIYRILPEDQRFQEGYAEFHNVEEKYNFGVHYVYSYLSQIVGVEVNTLTGETRVIHTEVIPAAGTVINRLGYEGQCEGGVLMSLGYALYEEFLTQKNGMISTKNFQTYLIPTIDDMPEINIYPVEDVEETGPFGANGIGEPTAVTGTAAIMNAIYDAVGVRITNLPCNKEKLLHGLNKSKSSERR